ncbi:MAG: 50S ribosomal protein L25 [Acidobacteriota bacterium]
MSISDLVIEVQKREELGSNPSRRMRRDGLVPAVVYGAGLDSVPIVVERRNVIELLQSAGGGNSVFKLVLGDNERHAMIHEMQVEPTTQVIQHIDFQRILMDEKVQVQVPLELVGTADGVKNQNGILDFINRELAVECLPGDIPPHLEVDISHLSIGDHLEAKDVPLSDKVELIDDPHKVLASIALPAAAASEEAEDEDGLLESLPAEPAVISKDD